MPGAQLTWHSASLSHVGRVRKLNEDSVLDRPDLGLWVVADGMGGHSAGDLASQMIVNALTRLKPQRQLSMLVDFVEHSILAVNNRLVELAKAQDQTIGSTVVTMLACESHCAYLWAGDSRLYRLRRGELVQLTTDHSQIERYIEQGLLERADANGHPAGNLVTRAVGATEELFLDIDMGELARGDCYLLCSDGLDKHLSYEEIAARLGSVDPQTDARRLIELTLARGAVDNVSACVVHIA